jgi:hypothetical protein
MANFLFFENGQRKGVTRKLRGAAERIVVAITVSRIPESGLEKERAF